VGKFEKRFGFFFLEVTPLLIRWRCRSTGGHFFFPSLFFVLSGVYFIAFFENVIGACDISGIMSESMAFGSDGVGVAGVCHAAFFSYFGNFFFIWRQVCEVSHF